MIRNKALDLRFYSMYQSIESIFNARIFLSRRFYIFVKFIPDEHKELSPSLD